MAKFKEYFVIAIAIMALTITTISSAQYYRGSQFQQQSRHFAPQDQQAVPQRRTNGFTGWIRRTFGQPSRVYREAHGYRSQRYYNQRNERFQRGYGTYRYDNMERGTYSEPERATTGRGDRVRYADKLCANGDTDQYKCVKVGRGQSWTKMFPDENKRDLVRRFNRVNTNIWAGMTIAVPKNLEKKELLDLAPLSREIETDGQKTIIVDLTKLAWAAYDKDGEMVKWGPVSGGKPYCPDVGAQCTTMQGVFQVFAKKNAHCKSGRFPADVGGGGAPMPYCMFFHKGFALHGSYEVPGYNASHGCVRMYKADAKWLNEEFVDLPDTTYDRGTKVIVRKTEIPDYGNNPPEPVPEVHEKAEVEVDIKPAEKRKFRHNVNATDEDVLDDEYDERPIRRMHRDQENYDDYNDDYNNRARGNYRRPPPQRNRYPEEDVIMW